MDLDGVGQGQFFSSDGQLLPEHGLGLAVVLVERGVDGQLLRISRGTITHHFGQGRAIGGDVLRLDERGHRLDGGGLGYVVKFNRQLECGIGLAAELDLPLLVCARQLFDDLGPHPIRFGFGLGDNGSHLSFG